MRTPTSRDRRRGLAGLAAAIASILVTALCLTAAPAHATPSGSPTTAGFEADAVGAVPAGCSTPAGERDATVSTTHAYSGTHALRVYDGTSTAQTMVSCSVARQEGAYLSFEVYPQSLPNGLIFDIDGAPKSPNAAVGNAVFHLLVNPSGALYWYNASGWHAFTAAGTVPLGQWSKIELTVPADESAVYVDVNGTHVGSADTTTDPTTVISSLTGYSFASAGTASYGDDAYVDDVAYGQLPTIPASTVPTRTYESDAVGAVPAGCVTPSGNRDATVSTTHAYSGTHALRVYDGTSTALTSVNCPQTPQQGASLTFEVYPDALPNGVAVDIDGDPQTPNAVVGHAVFHLLLDPNGALSWYDAGGWHTLAGAGTLPLDQWSKVQLDVSADNSWLTAYVNGFYVGAGGPTTAAGVAIRSLTGYAFDSAGTASYGDDVYVDDLSFGSLSGTPGSALPVHGYESDTVGAVPAGCGTPSGDRDATVSSTRGYNSTHSLRVYDGTSTALTAVSCGTNPQQGAALGFEIYPDSLPNGVSFDIYGRVTMTTPATDTTPTTTTTALSAPVFHLLIAPNGSIDWYQGPTPFGTKQPGWLPLAPAGTVTLGQWSHIEADVPADNTAVHVSVNGTYVGTGGSDIGDNGALDPGDAFNSVSDIQGYGFASAGTAPYGDDVYVDDVTFGRASDAPAAATTVGTPAVAVSPAREIYDDGRAMIPTSDVVVPNGTGKRILADFGIHRDTNHATGNQLSYSDNGGASWASFQSHNPMPDDPSMFLTLLSNGDLLAVDYHTYMTNPTATSSTQAEVDTAISHDDGLTWTKRTGTLTTPQPMPTLGGSERCLDASSACGPGVADADRVQLGGLLPVHNVVEGPNGVLYQSAYGHYQGDARFRNVLLVSSDEGKDWSVRATVAVPSPAPYSSSYYQGPCEGAVARVADGSLMMVMRTGDYQPMVYSRSTDDGLTWSTPQQITTGPADQPLASVFPTLQLMGNGRLVMSLGRPGVAVAVSADGLGDDWSTPVGVEYATSENTTIAAYDASHLVMISDRGRIGPWQMWSRTIGIG
jgi:hypothetical protein